MYCLDSVDFQKRHVWKIVQKNPTYLKTTHTDPLENKIFLWSFIPVLYNFRFLEDTIKKHKSLVLQVIEKIRDHIGNLSPNYQVQSLRLLSHIGSSEDIAQQHRDILAQERDDIWLQVLDLKMRFDIPWSKLEGYMYVGAVRYLSKLDLPNLPMAYEQAYGWSVGEDAPHTRMELLSIMIDYQLQKGDLEGIKTYWNPFVDLVEEQRDSLFLFRKEVLGLRLQSLGIVEARDIEDILRSVDRPIQKITLIRMYVNQPESKNRPTILHKAMKSHKKPN